MITYTRGDILTSGAKALVNPVNCVGISGAGLAKAFAWWAPDAQIDYARACDAGQMRPGSVIPIIPNRRRVTIYYFATKGHWRAPSQIEWIADGLGALERRIVSSGCQSVAIPALGCGLGELRWADVCPLIHAAAERMSAAGTRVLIYEPRERPGRPAR